ncbi:DUF7544 domain-containing protein [Halobaculum sp. EA56]|uniref:DUF7544 domain-containing protein n=1 Tax=Halobaculum sp. EA56 TaxID=3421648 RepID=UPI003EC0A24B
MSWHGVDAVDDAIDATRGFLFPATVGRWARTAVVTLFAGGGGGGGTQALSNAGNFAARLAGSGGLGSGPGAASSVAPLLVTLPAILLAAVPSLSRTVPAPVPIQANWLPAAVGAVGIAAILLGVTVALVAVVLSPVFEFVLVDGIARDDLRLRRGIREHLVNGLRYLGFQIGLFAAFLVPPAAVAAIALLTGMPVERLVDRPLALAALGLVVLVYVVVYVLLARFTREFVVPAMVADGGGVIDGWRRVWPTLRGQPWQTLVYLVMHLLVGIGVSIVSAILLLLGLLVVAVIAGVVGLAVGAVAGGAGGASGMGAEFGMGVGFGLGLVAAAVVGIPLFVVAVGLPVRVLTVTFTRTYELAALGRFSSGLDLIGHYRDDGDGDRDEAETGGEGGDDGGDTAATTGGDDGDDGPDADDSADADSEDGAADDGFGGFVPATAPREDDEERDTREGDERETRDGGDRRRRDHG